MTSKTPKILLVNPPADSKAPSMPLGLAFIAGYLKSKEKGIEISVIDAWAEDISFEELERRAVLSKAEIVGIYMVSPRYRRAKLAIEACRRALPESVIIAGGPHTSAVPIETLQDIPQLDIAAIGEGEITMHELVLAVKNRSSLEQVNGIAFRGKNEEIIVTKPRDFIKNLDELPFAARELFPVRKYKPLPPFGRRVPYLTMNTSRGCPYQCAFCSKSTFKDFYRAMSPKRVVDEIEEMISKYGVKEIFVTDDDFTLNMKRAEGICDEIIQRKLKVIWSTSTRADQLSYPLLEKMKKAGCWFIVFGVESGNQKILDTINKGIKIEKTIWAFETCRKAGVAPACSFIVGLPGETKETIQDTANLIKKMKPGFVSGGVLVAYPGSRFSRLVSEGKYNGKLRILSEDESQGRIFLGKGNNAVFEDNLTYEQMQAAISTIERQFYLRPQYIIQCLRNIRSFADIRYYINSGWAVIKSIIR